MNYRIPSCIVAALTAAALAHAGPAEDVAGAAKQLADASNYSWKSTTQNAGGGGGGGGGGRGGFGGPQSGVAEKGGFAVITRETQNGALQTVLHGEKVVQQTQNGWMTLEEIRAQAQGGGRGGFGGGGAQVLPAAQVSQLLAGASDFKMVDGAIVATLGAETVAPLLAAGRGGRGGGGGGQAPAAQNAAGTLKVWIKDGALVKYETNVTGKIQGRNGEVDVNRTTTIEISNIGSTKVEVPAEAKAKLGA